MAGSSFDILVVVILLCAFFWAKSRSSSGQLQQVLQDGRSAFLTLWKGLGLEDGVKKGVNDVRDRRPSYDNIVKKWTSVDFRYPAFPPWHDFDIRHTKPIPYRPFRWGPTYPINMGIRPMKWDDWIELDNLFLDVHKVRLERTRTRGEKAVRTFPEATGHALEVCCELASYLSLRYPKIFRVTRRTYKASDPSTHGDSLVGPQGGSVKNIELLPTGERWDLDVDDPMTVAGLLVQEDLAIMVEGDDGQYRFLAGSVCTAGFWRLEDKIGRTLSKIHTSGNVAQFKEKLQFSMERFFQKLKVDRPVTRNNYFFQIDDSLAWSDNTNGPEDIFDQWKKGPTDSSIKGPEPTINPLDVWFRTERQSLRRMPKTGCILFTVRTYFHPVHELVKEPGVPGRMADAIRSWPTDVASYKGKELYGDALLPWLDELHEEQVNDGVFTEQHRTSGYPFS